MRIPTPVTIALAVVGVAAIVAVAIGPPPETKPETSTEAVAASGATTIDFNDPVHDRDVDASLWSPTGTDRSHLVVISHGFAGDRTSHGYLASDLAADGYTVVAPTHPDLAGLESGNPDLDPLVLRPRHIGLAIDAAEQATSTSAFDQVTVVGHSLGGYSALRTVGLEVSTDGVAAHCAEQPDDEVLCGSRPAGRFDALADRAPAAGDERVDRVVLLAPGYGPLFAAEELAGVDVPVLVIEASADEEVDGGQLDTLLAGLPSATIDSSVDGGHFVFVRACTDDEADAAVAICTDPEGVDRAAVHTGLVEEIGSFLAG